jgi:hypothetical protein
MKLLLLMLLVSLSAGAATFTTTQAGAVTAAATWGGSLPGPSDDVVLAHAVTLGGGGITYNTMTIGSRGQLTISATVPTTCTLACPHGITISDGRTNGIGLASIGASAANYAQIRISANVLSRTTGVAIYNASFAWVSLTLNGNLTVSGVAGSGINARLPFLNITVNGNVACNAMSSIGVVTGASTPSVVVNGDVHADLPDAGIAYGYGIKASGGTVQINGDLYCTGSGWVVKCEGGSVTVGDAAHPRVLTLNDSTTGLGYNADGADVEDPGSYTFWGNIYAQRQDVTVFCRGGTMNVHGNIYHAQTGLTLNRAVRVVRGTCNLYGHVYPLPGSEDKSMVEVQGGTLNVYGDLIRQSVFVTNGVTNAVLNTYGAVRSVGNCFTNWAIWNHVGETGNTVAPLSGTNTVIPEPGLLLGL